MTASSSTSAEIKQEEVFLRYIHLRKIKGRVIAEFRPSKNSKPIAKIGIKPEFFKMFAEVFRLEPVKTNEKEIIYVIDKDEVFDLALLYACIIRTLRRNNNNIHKIIDAMLNLHPFELTFWNYKLINARNWYEQNRIARAFLTIYGVR